MLARVFSRGRKAEGEGDEAKKYKKANLGLSNQMYYSEELKMWVERGKEDEARAEKAKLSAPPPSVSSMSAASSTTSLTGFAEAAGGGAPAPAQLDFSRKKGLAGRYVSTLPGATAAAPAAPGKGLLPGGKLPGLPGLPGAPGGLPGLPGAPGGLPPLPFMPTPSASEALSELAGGSSEQGSASGLSGMDASLPNSRTPSQPSFFMPEPLPAAGAGAEQQGAEQQPSPEPPPEPQLPPDGLAERESSVGTSGSAGGPPALSMGPGNLSFGAWQPLSTLPGRAAPRRSTSLAEPDADAEAEVSSPLTLIQAKHLQQQGSGQTHGEPQQQELAHDDLLHPGAESNGHHAPYANGDGAHAAAPEQGLLAGGDAAAPAAPWGSQPAQPELASSAEPAAAAAWDAEGSGWAGGGESGWAAAGDGGEGGSAADWQAQADPFDAAAPAADGGAGSWAGMEQQPQQAWNGEAAPAAAGGGAWGSPDAEGGGDAAGAAAAPQLQYAAADGLAADCWAQQQQQEQQQQQQHHEQQHHEQQPYDQQQQYWQQQQQHGEQYWQQPQYESAAAAGATSNGNHGAPYSHEAGVGVQAAGSSYGFDQQQHPAATADAAAAGGPCSPTGGADTQQPVLLDPVHPQLPGISVANVGSGDFSSPLVRPSGSSGSSGRFHRHVSTPGSPSATGGLGALLPQPPRPSFGGRASPGSPLGGGAGVGLGSAEASALTLPPPVAAGDASMLTAVRPSSPYARPVSPLARTVTGMGDHIISGSGAGAGGGGGFPIPSPPSNGSAFGGAALGPAAGSSAGQLPPFVPAGALSAGGGAAAAPWQPGAHHLGAGSRASSGGVTSPPKRGSSQEVQQGEHFAAGAALPSPLPNGYLPAASTQHDQLHAAGALSPPPPAGRPVSSPVPGSSWLPGGEAAPSGGHAPARAMSPLDAQPARPWRDGGAGAGGGGNDRSHPYEQFLGRELAAVNWRAHHFKQPGKLSKQLPWEAFEMERERSKQHKAGGGGAAPQREDGFWYRQMEHRQTLPPAAIKPSASEPAGVGNHAAAAAAGYAPPQSPGDSSLSQLSNYTDWQAHHARAAPHGGGAGSLPGTPARAATSDVLGAVAGAHAAAEEPTPTSKFVPLAAGAEDGATLQPVPGGPATQLPQPPDVAQQQPGAEAGAAAAAGAAEGGWGAGSAEGGWAGYHSEQQAQQAQQAQQHDASYWQYGEQQQQQYGEQQQPYQGQGQYDQGWGAWEQPQQPHEQQEQLQQQHAWGGEAQAAEQLQQQQAWGGEAQAAEQLQQQQAWGGEAQAAEQLQQQQAWGGEAQAAEQLQQQQSWSADGQQLPAQQPQQGLDEAWAAAAPSAADGLGGEDLGLDLGLPRGDTGGAAAAAAAAAHAEPQPGALHPPALVAAARAARISASSLHELESQPSTGRAAAAAARHIVGRALDNILREHAVAEDAEQEAAAAAAEAAEAAEQQGAAAAAEAAAAGADAEGAAAPAHAADRWWGDEDADAVAAEAAAAAYQAGEADAAALALEHGAGEQPADAPEQEQEQGEQPGAHPPEWLRLRSRLQAGKADAHETLANWCQFMVEAGDYVFHEMPHLAPDPEAVAAAAAAAAEAAAAAAAAAAAEGAEADEDAELAWQELGEAHFKLDCLRDVWQQVLGVDMDMLLGAIEAL